MAKQMRDGGCRSWWGRFSIPRTSIDSGETLPVFAPVAQQCTVAATHQIQPALHQADGTAAQIVSLPASVGNPVLPEQALCDRIPPLRAALFDGGERCRS
jgi:hypothetical protein